MEIVIVIAIGVLGGFALGQSYSELEYLEKEAKLKEEIKKATSGN